VGVRDIEAIEKPVPDEVEIRGHGGARAAHQAEQLGLRDAGPVTDVREEVTRRDRPATTRGEP
jgi:hypothetical protein